MNKETSTEEPNELKGIPSQVGSQVAVAGKSLLKLCDNLLAKGKKHLKHAEHTLAATDSENQDVKEPTDLTSEMHDQQESELFLKALTQQVAAYSMRLSASNVDIESDPKRWKAIGRFWKHSRLLAGKDRDVVAFEMGISRHTLTFFENGMIPVQDLPHGFLLELAEVLGHPEFYEMHRTFWDIPSSKDPVEGLESESSNHFGE